MASEKITHRNKGIVLMKSYNWVMAALEFMEAIDLGDAASYAYLGQLLYDGNYTADGNPDVNGALNYWKQGMDEGDERCAQLYANHSEERMKKPKEITFKNGDCYFGDVNRDGKPHGSGHMDYKLNGYYASYDGMWKDGQRSGKGRYHKFSSGGGARHSYDYQGEWLNDMEHGEGEATNSDETGIHLSTVSETYTGGFKEGKRHGHGVVVRDGFDGNFASGKDRFEGEFKEGKTVGKGVLELANGDRFEGGFAGYERKHGPGVYTFKNGMRLCGEWDNDRLVEDSLRLDPPMETPVLLVKEHHSGFDYNKTGRFLFPVTKVGMALYEDAVVLFKDSSFNMNGSGLNIISLTKDSVTLEIRGVFYSDGQPREVTVRRGETLIAEDSHRATATIYDDDYDYTIEDSIEIYCK
ncbi:MAG: hypothetical protein IJR77_02960 [Bacteroidales bacterium]|nr:hypothetical protein [Bacteroidales bacterium]